MPKAKKLPSIKDVIVRYGEEDYPPVIGIVARYRRRNFFISRLRISTLNEHGAKMNSEIIDLKPFTRRKGEVLLAKDVLDKQLIDVDGKRVVRVNDVQIIEVGNEWRVSGADVSLQGFVRRLMPAGFYGSRRPVEVIDWADVGYLATDKTSGAVQLKSSKDKLSRLHPVEIAQLAESLSPIHRTEIVESLDDEIAADTLEEMSTENQARILEDMDEERAADILEEMSPDDAVDVLGEMDEEKAQELFDLMEEDEKADVAELLPFESDTAGGLMTTEFVVFPKDLTVSQAIARLARDGGNAEYDLLPVCRRRRKFVEDCRSDYASEPDFSRPDLHFANRLCAKIFSSRIRAIRRRKPRIRLPNTICWRCPSLTIWAKSPES